MVYKNNLHIMDEKRPMRYRARHRHRWVAVLFIVTIPLYMLFSSRAVSSYAGRFLPVSSSQAPSSSSLSATTTTTSTENPPVPLEIHIMSKCPDARDCLNDLVLPAMVRANEKVNFTLSYIGAPTENDGIECKHGPKECMGNIIELCAVHLYPDVKVHLGFTHCLTQDYEDIPDSELVEECALEYGMSIGDLNDCASRDDGAFGLSLLRGSVKRSADVCFSAPKVLGQSRRFTNYGS
ncbi:hypothetical protein DL768_009303 [Monosporascus sp. mg162]|nr:hypothetical protein DL768_009303 [Monosporascus sp. mg162]